MYTAPEVASAFSALYNNEFGLQDKMLDFWKVVAAKFEGNPNVIGYDIFNEPWAANIYREPSLFYETEKFDREKLFPMAQRADAAVRTVDNKKAIFFEPAQIPDTLPFLGGKTRPIGFPETPGGINYLDRQVLNDHSYCCQASGSMCADGEPPLEKADVCRKFHAQKAKARRESANEFGVPLIFSEFGACFDGEKCQVEIDNSVDAFDD